jgi:hypothetical protein
MEAESGSGDYERAGLLRMLASGPWRRMAQDRALGMGPQRADMVQARSYRLRLEALDRGRGEDVATDGDESVDDGLGLDRITRRD